MKKSRKRGGPRTGRAITRKTKNKIIRKKTWTKTIRLTKGFE